MTRKFTGDQILIATHNAGKLAEMAELFAPFGVRVVGHQRTEAVFLQLRIALLALADAFHATIGTRPCASASARIASNSATVVGSSVIGRR